jgi:hypothetical protein
VRFKTAFSSLHLRNRLRFLAAFTQQTLRFLILKVFAPIKSQVGVAFKAKRDRAVRKTQFKIARVNVSDLPSLDIPRLRHF